MDTRSQSNSTDRLGWRGRDGVPGVCTRSRTRRDAATAAIRRRLGPMTGCTCIFNFILQRSGVTPRAVVDAGIDYAVLRSADRGIAANLHSGWNRGNAQRHGVEAGGRTEHPASATTAERERAVVSRLAAVDRMGVEWSPYIGEGQDGRDGEGGVVGPTISAGSAGKVRVSASGMGQRDRDVIDTSIL